MTGFLWKGKPNSQPLDNIPNSFPERSKRRDERPGATWRLIRLFLVMTLFGGSFIRKIGMICGEELPAVRHQGVGTGNGIMTYMDVARFSFPMIQLTTHGLGITGRSQALNSRQNNKSSLNPCLRVMNVSRPALAGLEADVDPILRLFCFWKQLQ